MPSIVAMSIADKSLTPDHSQQPRSAQVSRGGRLGRHLGWLVFILWIAYSGAVLGWHALSAPPVDACLVR